MWLFKQINVYKSIFEYDIRDQSTEANRYFVPPILYATDTLSKWFIL